MRTTASYKYLLSSKRAGVAATFAVTFAVTALAVVGVSGNAAAQQPQPMQPMPPMQPMQPMPAQPMPSQPSSQPGPGQGAAPNQGGAPAQPNNGGLAPLAPMDPNAQSTPNGESNTKATLEAADKADDGRNFELIYVNGEVGASYINMTQFATTSDSQGFGLQQAQSAGPAFGLAAGVRLVVLMFGVRARLNQLSSFSLWQLNAEAGFKFPIKLFDIYITAHGGYDFLGSLDKAALSSDTQASSGDVTVRGWNAGLDAGVDYYLVPMFSIGAGVSGDFLALNRPKLALPSSLTADQQAAIQSNPLYQQSGQSYGFGIMGGVRLGLHFGF